MDSCALFTYSIDHRAVSIKDMVMTHGYLGMCVLWYPGSGQY